MSYFIGDELLTTVYQKPFNYNWTDATSGTHLISVQVQNASHTFNYSDSVKIIVAGEVLPPWISTYIGEPDNGSISFINDTLEIESNTAGNLTEQAVQFQYVFQPWRDTCEFIAKLDIANNSTTGLMITKDLTSSTGFAFIGLSGEKQVVCYAKDSTNGESILLLDTTQLDGTAFFKLSLYNSLVYAFYSEDSIDWYQLPPLGFQVNDYFAGFAVSNSKSGDMAYAQFSSYKITNTIDNYVPTIEILSPAKGSEFFTNSAVTVSAEALDAENSISRVEFYHQNVLDTFVLKTPFEYQLKPDNGLNNIYAIVYDDKKMYSASDTILFIVPVFLDSLKINFQPLDVSVPEGYIADYGNEYVIDSNFIYGWSNTNPNAKKGIVANDIRYKTFNYLQSENNDDLSWEIGLPENKYDLRIVCGDADNRWQINNLIIEDSVVMDSDGEDNFDEFILSSVEVKDGRLTIKAGENASEAKICFLEIYNEDKFQKEDTTATSIISTFYDDVKIAVEPNPFVSEFQLKYSVPQASLVQIKIFNLNGQLVETIVNDIRPMGRYSLNLNGDNISHLKNNGIYICEFYVKPLNQDIEMVKNIRIIKQP